MLDDARSPRRPRGARGTCSSSKAAKRWITSSREAGRRPDRAERLESPGAPAGLFLELAARAAPRAGRRRACRPAPPRSCRPPRGGTGGSGARRRGAVERDDRRRARVAHDVELDAVAVRERRPRRRRRRSSARGGRRGSSSRPLPDPDRSARRGGGCACGSARAPGRKRAVRGERARLAARADAPGSRRGRARSAEATSGSSAPAVRAAARSRLDRDGIVALREAEALAHARDVGVDRDARARRTRSRARRSRSSARRPGASPAPRACAGTSPPKRSATSRAADWIELRLLAVEARRAHQRLELHRVGPRKGARAVEAPEELRA